MNLHGFRKFRVMVEVVGWYRALMYVFFTVGLERLGICINSVYERSIKDRSASPLPTNFSAGWLEKWDDQRESDRAALQEYGGRELVETFRRNLENRKQCLVIWSPQQQLASVCWAERQNLFAPCTASPCLLISQCFTLPAYRGFSLYPSALSTLLADIPDEWAGIGTAVIECSVGNYASRRGILKAGFSFCGWAFEFRGRRRTLSRGLFPD